MFPDQRWLGLVLIVLAVIFLIAPALKKEQRAMINIGIIPIIWIIIGCFLLVFGAIIIRYGFNLVWSPTKIETTSNATPKDNPTAHPQAPDPLMVSVGGNTMDYAPDTKIAGIQWAPIYADVRMSLRNHSDRNITDLDVLITTDLIIMAIGQISGIPGVTFMPHDKPPMAYLPIINADGKTVYKPLIPSPGAPQSATTYRARCPVLPRYSQIDLVLAVIVLNKVVNNDPNTAIGKKRLPKWVQINAHYSDSGKEKTFDVRIPMEPKP